MIEMLIGFVVEADTLENSNLVEDLKDEFGTRMFGTVKEAEVFVSSLKVNYPTVNFTVEPHYNKVPSSMYWM